MRAYSSGSSRCVAPWVTRNSVAMSELHSSLMRLFTARSLQMALKRSRGAGQPRRHVAAVAAAEHADPVGVGRGVAPQRLVEDGVHVVDVDRAPALARAPSGGSGPLMAWPQAVSRPDEPRGLPITTT